LFEEACLFSLGKGGGQGCFLGSEGARDGLGRGGELRDLLLDVSFSRIGIDLLLTDESRAFEDAGLEGLNLFLQSFDLRFILRRQILQICCVSAQRAHLVFHRGGTSIGEGLELCLDVTNVKIDGGENKQILAETDK
jgi:hypothetical protein